MRERCTSLRSHPLTTLPIYVLINSSTLKQEYSYLWQVNIPWCTWVTDYFIELTTCSNLRIFAALKYLLLKVQKSLELLFILMKELARVQMWLTTLFHSTITTISLLNWEMLQEGLMSLVIWVSYHKFVVVRRYSEVFMQLVKQYCNIFMNSS